MHSRAYALCARPEASYAVDKRKEHAGPADIRKPRGEETWKNASRATTTRQCGHRALKLDALYRGQTWFAFACMQRTARVSPSSGEAYVDTRT